MRPISCFGSATGDRLHHMLVRGLRFCAVLALLIIGGGVLAGSAGAAPVKDTAIVTRCKADLALRTKIKAKDITTIDARAMAWPDAALGLPEPGKMYAQVQTPGFRIVLEARGVRYLYTASARAIRYGGPLSLWTASMLYLLPVANEPNMNGDLYQCSLLGANHVRIASEVAAYYPQAKGEVLFTRRTSRSGFELWSVKAGVGAKPQKLHGAFDYGEAALNEAQDTWAAFVRAGLGGEWNIVVGRIGQDDVVTLPLPEGVRPGRIAWSENRLAILVPRGEGMASSFEIDPSSAAPEWKPLATHLFPGALDFMLNKSETLEITQSGTKEKPSVEVARVWFTGDRNVKATIIGLTLRGYNLLGAGYAFVWGEKNGKAAAYAVNISTGEVTPSFYGTGQDIKPFEYPPVTMP